MREIPLSDSPNGQRQPRLIPSFDSLASSGYIGDFAPLHTRVIGLKTSKTEWDLAQRIVRTGLWLELEHDGMDEQNRNIVTVYHRLPDGGRKPIGQIDPKGIERLVEALDAGAIFLVRAVGGPWSMISIKGGFMEVEISLAT